MHCLLKLRSCFNSSSPIELCLLVVSDLCGVRKCVVSESKDTQVCQALSVCVSVCLCQCLIVCACPSTFCVNTSFVCVFSDCTYAQELGDMIGLMADLAHEHTGLVPNLIAC